MNILIANDDGIKARGIQELVTAMSQVANVYVAAPHIQRSATGHGITINDSMTMKPVEFKDAKGALEITGTPADCVKLGIGYFESKGIKIDMVYAGINEGANLGTDTLYSGTVSAAIEGNILGKPAVAVSVCSHKPKHFEYACMLAQKAFKEAALKLDSRTVLNINTPNKPAEEIKGVKYARLGKRDYEGWFNPVKNHKGELEVAYSGYPKEYNSDDLTIDVIAFEQGYATITPLKYDLTNHYLIEEVESWGIDK
ncbi:MAG: 5'/3'-nucleotidase SurE [Anaerovoracaceae bacterium]